jgi:hypothetical protein
VAVAIKDAVAVVTVCCATLKDEVVNQILNAMNFEKRMQGALNLLVSWRKNKLKMEKSRDGTS